MSTPVAGAAVTGTDDPDASPGGPGSWRAEARLVLPSWLVARVLVGVGYALAWWVAQRWFPPGEPSQLHEGLLAWDGTYYRDIATVGYANLPVEALRFFPLYPLLGRGLGAVLRGRVDLALVLVANGCSFALAMVMHRLARFEKHDEGLARRAVWLTALFPSAFVLAWAYAEGLFLVLAVAAFWSVRRDRWLLAAGLAFLAALTRPLGVLLVVPFLVEACRVRHAVPLRTWAARAAGVAAPVAGAGLYLAWVGRTFADAALPFTVQNQLRGEANPVLRLGRGLGDLVGPERFGDGLHIPFAIAFVALLVVLFRRWPVSYGLFAALVLLAALSADNLNSLERYALNAFPLVLALATVTAHERVERVALVVGGAGVASLAALAWLGVYVP